MNDKLNRPHLEALEGGREGAGGPRLYRVHTTANAFEYDSRRYDNVCITWLAEERNEPPVPYDEVVEGWESLEAGGPGELWQQREYAQAATRGGPCLVLLPQGAVPGRDGAHFPSSPAARD